MTRGPADTATTSVLTDLGGLARQQGDFQEAEERLMEAVEPLRDRRPLPAAHPARILE